MSVRPHQTWVVTGTDTDVGKTVFAAGLAGALGARYWKPVQAGISPTTDTDSVAQLSSLPQSRIHPEAYRLETPASPHLAARIDGVTIELEGLTLPVDEGPLVVEGAGGVLVPLTDTLLMADLFAHWRAPVILCARTGLGTINHSLLSIESLRARGVQVAAIAFIGEAHAENERIVPLLGQVPSLGRLPHLDALTPATLRQAFAAHIDLSPLT